MRNEILVHKEVAGLSVYPKTHFMEQRETETEYRNRK